MENSQPVPEPSQTIPNSNQPPNRPKKKHLKHTNILLTVNTNEYISEDTKDSVRLQKISKLKEAILKIFNKYFVANYISIKQDKRTPPGSAVSSEWFKTDALLIQYSVERGPKTGFLHAHIGIFIPHYTLIKLESEKLYQDLGNVMKESGWPGFHLSPVVYGRLASDVDHGLMNYIAKSPL
jgi:hypothetical protein